MPLSDCQSVLYNHSLTCFVVTGRFKSRASGNSRSEGQFRFSQGFPVELRYCDVTSNRLCRCTCSGWISAYCGKKVLWECAIYLPIHVLTLGQRRSSIRDIVVESSYSSRNPVRRMAPARVMFASRTDRLNRINVLSLSIITVLNDLVLEITGRTRYKRR